MRPQCHIVQKPAAWTSGLALGTPRTRSHACGYWLSANAAQATERLGMMGRLCAACGGAVFAGRGNLPKQRSRNRQWHHHYQSGTRPHGSRTRQLLRQHEPTPAFLAAAALEPDTPYSFYSHGILSQLNETARVVALPQIVFEEE